MFKEPTVPSSPNDQEIQKILQDLAQALGIEERRDVENDPHNNLYRKALERVPELGIILVRAARGEISREDALRESQPLLEKFQSEYEKLMRNE